MRIRMAQQLRDPNYRISFADFVHALKIERLIEGEATERVDVTAEIERKLAGMPEPLLREVAGLLLRGEDFDVEGFAGECGGADAG